MLAARWPKLSNKEVSSFLFGPVSKLVSPSFLIQLCLGQTDRQTDRRRYGDRTSLVVLRTYVRQLASKQASLPTLFFLSKFFFALSPPPSPLFWPPDSSVSQSVIQRSTWLLDCVRTSCWPIWYFAGLEMGETQLSSSSALNSNKIIPRLNECFSHTRKTFGKSGHKK